MNEEKSMANTSTSCLEMEENNSIANYSEIIGSQVKSDNRYISRIVAERIIEIANSKKTILLSFLKHRSKSGLVLQYFGLRAS